MKDTTTTIDVLVDWLLHEPSYTPHQMKGKILQWHKDKARSYVLEVIGKDYVFDRPKDDYLPNTYRHLKAKNELRAEQRYRLDQTLKAIEGDK